MKFQTKRIYDAPEASDGVRILIDRLWPRGISKERAAIDFWAKELAPSTELRRWFAREAKKWDAFQERYFTELDANPDALETLRAAISPTKQNTIVFASKESELNNATALVRYLEEQPTSRSPARLGIRR